MDAVTCPSCGRVLSASKTQPSVACAHCGEIVDLLSLRRRAATEALLLHLHQGWDLPPKLRAELIERAEEELHALLDDSAEAGPEPFEAEPAPRGATPPPLPPRRTSTSDVVEKAARKRRHEKRRHGERRERERRERRARREVERERARAEPTIWSRLGPAFAENLGFGLATFLIVAGAVYFTTTAWTTMTGDQRLLVVVGGLVFLGFFLWGAGRLLNRGGTLPEVERVLLIVVAFLVPVAALPAGDLLWRSPLLGFVGVVLVLPPGFLAARSLARLLDPPLSPFLPAALTAFSALVLLGKPAGTVPVAAGTGGAVLLFTTVALYARRVVRPAEKVSAVWLWPPILIAFALLVFTARASLAGVAEGRAAQQVLATLGITLSAFGASLIPVESSLFERGAFGPRRSVVLLTSAIALAIAGSVVALGHPTGLLVASALGAYAAICAGLRLPVAWLAVPGLVLAALAYLKSPAPVREYVIQVRDAAARSLDYEPQKLPLAYYGLTFIPYVAGVGLWGWWLLRKERFEQAHVMLTWALVSASGLTVLSLLTSGHPPFSDLRAPAAVLGAQGALVFALGAAARSRWIAFAGLVAAYAGAALGLLHLETARTLFMLVMSALALGGVAVAARLAGSTRSLATPLRAALVDGAAVVCVLAAFVALRDTIEPPNAPSWWQVFGYLALAVLAAVLGHAYRRPEPYLLTGGAFGFAVLRLLAVVVPSAAGDSMPLALAVASAAMLFVRSLARRLPVALRHPHAKDHEDPSSFGAGSVFIVQAIGWVMLLAAPGPPAWSWLLAAGFAIGAAVLVLSAFRYDRSWPAVVGYFEWVVAALAVAGALGHAPLGSSGLLAVVIASAVGFAPLYALHRRGRTLLLTPAVLETLFFATVPIFVWACLLLVEHALGVEVPVDGIALAAGSLLYAGVIRLAYDVAPQAGLREAGGIAAGLLFLPAAYALLERLGARVDGYALGFLGAAAVTFVWAGRARTLRGPAGVHAVISFLVAVGAAVSGAGDPWILLVTFALLGACGRYLATAAPTWGSLLFLLSVLAAVSFVLFRRIVEVDPAYLPAVFLLFTVAARVATRVPALAVTRRAAHVVSMPILALAGLMMLAAALWIALTEPATKPYAVQLPAWRVDIAAFVVTALAWAVGVGRARRWILLAAAAALGSFVLAPINLLLAGSDDRLWRPDVEVGLVGALLALVLPRVDRPLQWKRNRLGGAAAAPVGFALVALVLTVGALTHPSTPLAAAAAMLVPLVLLWRDRRPGWARAFGIGLLVTALAFAAWLRPRRGELAVEPLLLFGATSALTAPLLVALAAFARRDRHSAWRRRSNRELVGVALVAAVAAFGFIVADLVAFFGRPAAGWAVALTAIALIVPGGAAAYGALRMRRPALIHVTVLSVVAFYAFLAQRTGHLAFLDGYHLHALAVIGATLLFLSQLDRGRLGTGLAVDGLLLAAPAGLYYVPMALGMAADVTGAPSALALSSIVCAAAGQRLRARGLFAVSIVLLNLVLYAFWRRHELVDPSLYGVPPGLTLIGAAIVMRSRITPAARLALLVPGVALLYGSVGLQVIQVGDPLHALVLFGMGLATVALGLRWNRSSWQVLGTSVVVLDVIAYIAAHGFERGFFGAALLVMAGLCVLAVVALRARKRRLREGRRSRGP